jgi:hypothetical protein
MPAQTFMLIECPRCFSLMRGRAKFCRRCGHKLPATPLAAPSETLTPAMLKRKLQSAVSLFAIGIVLLIGAVMAGSVGFAVIGVFLVVGAIVGYSQDRKKLV